MFLVKEDQIPQDWNRLAEYLSGQGFKLSLDDQPQQFASGAANINFLITLDGKKAVLRRPPNGPLPKGANDVHREYRVLSRLWVRYPFAPMGLHYCDDISVLGVPFCISEFREGIPIRSELPESLQSTPDIGRKLGQITIEALAALHSIDPKEVGLEGLGKAEGFIERQIHGWKKRGSVVMQGELASLQEDICQGLLESLPRYQPSSIVHNDFKLDNMLIDPESLTVNGVVDWDMCTLGNPLYELAVLLVYWGQSDDLAVYKHLTRMPSNADGWMSRRDAIDAYLKQVPFELSEQDLRFYVTLAIHRSAVVLAQLCSLYSNGAMKSTAFTEEDIQRANIAIPEVLAHARELLTSPLPW